MEDAKERLDGDAEAVAGRPLSILEYEDEVDIEDRDVETVRDDISWNIRKEEVRAEVRLLELQESAVVVATVHKVVKKGIKTC